MASAFAFIWVSMASAFAFHLVPQVSSDAPTSGLTKLKFVVFVSAISHLNRKPQGQIALTVRRKTVLSHPED